MFLYSKIGCAHVLSQNEMHHELSMLRIMMLIIVNDKKTGPNISNAALLTNA